MEEPRRQPRSTLRVVGGLGLFVLVSLFIFVSCLRAYIGSAPDATFEVRRDQLQTDVPQFFAMPSMGYDIRTRTQEGSRTHGVWLTLLENGNVLAFSSRDPAGDCFTAFEAATGVYKNVCNDSLYAQDGSVLYGVSTRGLDRYRTSRDEDFVVVDLSELIRGPAKR